MTGKLQTEQNLEFLPLNGGCTGFTESTLVKMPRCWKSHVAAQIDSMQHITVKCLNILQFIPSFCRLDHFSPAVLSFAKVSSI